MREYIEFFDILARLTAPSVIAISIGRLLAIIRLGDALQKDLTCTYGAACQRELLTCL
jgi:hypothetical protein